MPNFRFLLYPFSILYDAITSIINFMFDFGLFYCKPYIPDVYSISIGNLSVGGTGKTPHVEYISQFLASKYHLFILSRGYGRKTKGIILANENSTAHEIGDEPMQYYTKFKDQLDVVVAEERSVAIPHYLKDNAKTQIVVLDDCFQHRRVLPHLNILLTEYYNIFYKDYILPAGNLRESRRGAKRADALIVTKCPEQLGYKKEYLKVKLSKFLKPNIPIFYTKVAYGALKPVWKKEESQPTFTLNQDTQVILVSGIANPIYFQNHVKQHFEVKEFISFPDHFDYALADFEKINQMFKKYDLQNTIIITTEKDKVKWTELSNNPLKELPVFFIPIEVVFLDENDFNFEQFIETGFEKYLQQNRN